MTRAELLKKLVVNPKTKNKVTVRYALRLPKTHPAYRAAVALVGKFTKKKSKKVVKAKSKPQSLGVNPERVADMAAYIKARKVELGVTVQSLIKYGEKYLNGVSPVEIAAKYLEIIDAKDTKDIEECRIEVQLPGSYYRHPRLEIAISLNNGTKITRVIKTSLKSKNSVIKNDYFELGREVKTGTGHAKRMLQETMKIADKINAKAVLFEAGLSAGAYVWAKYGGIPTPHHRVRLYQGIHEMLSDIDEDAQLKLQDANELISYYTMQLNNAQAIGDFSLIPYYKRQLNFAVEKLNSINKLIEQVKADPKTIKLLQKLFAKQVDIIRQQEKEGNGSYSDAEIGRHLSPDLLNFMSHTFLGKFFLLDNYWDGYFNMRKGSLGRTMLEKEVNQ